MAITLVVEDGTGRANANAFASRETVSQRLTLTPFADAWEGVDVDRQDQCIAEASAWLSRQPWEGIATTSTQALAFPRAHLCTRDGYAIASNLVPLWLIDATARTAYWLSQQASTPFADSGLQPGTRMSLPGGISFTIAAGTSLPPDVRSLIGYWIQSGLTVVRV